MVTISNCYVRYYIYSGLCSPKWAAYIYIYIYYACFSRQDGQMNRASISQCGVFRDLDLKFRSLVESKQ